MYILTFTKVTYLLIHMKNIHGQVPNTGPKVVEVNKKNEGSDKESSDEDSQEDDDIEKYNPGERHPPSETCQLPQAPHLSLY
jgi:hypothetical protein